MRVPAVIMLSVSALVLAACGSGPHSAAPVSAPILPTSAASTPTPKPVTHRPPPRPSPKTKPRPRRTHSAAPLAAVGGPYVFPVRCSVTYAHSHHDYPATDIMAARGCPVVAVTNGRIDEVSYTDTWSSKSNDGATRGGLSVSIIGADGVRYYGSHLESIANGIAPGVRVKAGQLLGRVGNTGDARGGPTHLHFGLSWPTPNDVWWIRRGMVYPWPYLDSWRASGKRSPAAAVAALHAKDGDEPPCRVDC